MPERHDHDIKKTNQVKLDPRHDTLISNPEYREVYNNAINEGLSTDEAHEHAQTELSGESAVEDLDDLRNQLTPRGQQILEKTIERMGEEWVIKNAEGVIAQARQVGMVDPTE